MEIMSSDNRYLVIFKILVSKYISIQYITEGKPYQIYLNTKNMKCQNRPNSIFTKPAAAANSVYFENCHLRILDTNFNSGIQSSAHCLGQHQLPSVTMTIVYISIPRTRSVPPIVLYTLAIVFSTNNTARMKFVFPKSSALL